MCDERGTTLGKGADWQQKPFEPSAALAACVRVCFQKTEQGIGAQPPTGTT